jgi:tetratricopeptide (TPR) repeat protein
VPPPIYHPYDFPNALGAVLIRAGRIDEAIARLNEGTAAAKEAKLQDYPTDWAYLALALARKGNFDEARRWLDRLRTFRPVPSFTFWDLQELALLRSEAESLLLDVEFPSDPFQGPGPR